MTANQPLVPQVCPQCRGENTIAVMADKLICRRCGYVIRQAGGKPLTPAQAVSQLAPASGPRRPLTASYAVSHRGPVEPWARAAFDTGQDCIRQQKWDEAVKAFYRAIDAQKDFIDPHLWIARIVDDPQVRRDHLTTILAYEPNHPEALRELMILKGELDPAAPAPNPFVEMVERQVGGAVSVKAANVRCKQCGSPRLAADEATGLVKCESCGYVDESARKRAEGDESLAAALLKRRAQAVVWLVGERLLHCNSCGAERTIPATKLSELCPFCGSTHVVLQDVLGTFQQPDGLVPFAVTRRQAGEAIQTRLAGWTERMKGWLNTNRIERAILEGVYLPFWLFDALVEVRRTVIVDNPGVGYTRETQLHPTQPAYSSTTIADAMNNVPVCAVISPSPHLTGRLGKYDLGAMVAYAPELLAEYPAELYTMDFDKASLEARAVIGRAMRERHGFAEQGGRVTIFTLVTQMSFQLVLLPVWVATLYEEDGDVRPALVNGQTGQVALGKARKPRY